MAQRAWSDSLADAEGADKSSIGWTLAETLQRVAPELWAAHCDEFESSKLPKKRTNQYGQKKSATGLNDPEQSTLSEANRTEALNILRCHHDAGELVMVEGGTPRKITATKLDAVSDIDLVDSRLIGRQGKKDISFRDIEVFPILHANDAPRRLAGKKLGEVFWRFVIRDPEVRARAKKAILAQQQSQKLFVLGEYGWMGGEPWPVKYENLKLAEMAVSDSTAAATGSGSKSRPSIKVCSAVSVLENRYASLIDLLRNGQIQAFGISDADDVDGGSAIPDFIWRAPDVFLNVADNQLLRGGSLGSRGSWFDIELRLPSSNGSRRRGRRGPPPMITPEIGRDIVQHLITREEKLPRTQDMLIEIVQDFFKKKGTAQ